MDTCVSDDLTKTSPELETETDTIIELFKLQKTLSCGFVVKLVICNKGVLWLISTNKVYNKESKYINKRCNKI